MHTASVGTLPEASGAARAAAREEYLVLLTAGPEDGGKRATLAYSLACTAPSMGRPARIFLVGDGAHWACEGRSAGVRVNGFPALDELTDSFVELGGEVFVCSACDCVCSLPGPAEGSMLRRRREVGLLGLAALLPHLEAGRSVTF